jgi:phosphatidylethanolamine-binding protein
MIDPDAPTPQNPSAAQILHWLQPDLHLTSNTSTGAVLQANSPAPAPYLRPAPPAGSPAHRYIQYLFAQPSTSFQVPANFTSFLSTRTRFDVASFATAARLMGPVAANYVLVARTGAGANGTMVGNGTAAGNGTAPQPFRGEATVGRGASRWGLVGLVSALIVLAW